MLVFYYELITVYVFSLYARLTSSRNKKLGIIFVVMVVGILIIVSGLRTNIGDTEAYVYLYQLIGPSYKSNGGYEPGFVLFFRVLKRVSNNPQFMILVTSFIVNSLNCWTLWRYPSYFELNLYIYITSGFYLVTMNGIRQSIAAAALFACTNFIIKGKFKHYVIAVFIASTIHTSAIIMIPIYFIARNKAWSSRIYFLIFLLVIGLTFYDQLINIVFSALSGSRYAQYKNFNEGGANIIRVFVSAMPIILAYIKRRELKEKWPESNIFINIALMDLVIMCFSTYNWIFARFTIYTGLYGVILLGYILKHCSRKKERNFLYYGIIVAYFIYFWYEQSITLNIHYLTNFKL